MNGIWSHRFEVVLRPLRDLVAAPTTVIVETRTAAQAGRLAAAQNPGMKVLSVTRLSDDGTVEVLPTTTAAVVPLARVARRR